MALPHYKGLFDMLRSMKALALTGLVFGCVGLVVSAEDKKPKFEIKEVMAKAMKGGLCKKVADGKATDEEKKELVELFEALAANKPPKGELSDWKAKTKALVDAAKAGDGSKLKAAANCAACHKLHK